MALYRKKPVIIEAIRFDGANVAEIAALLGWDLTDGDSEADTIVIETLEGDMTVNVGDWVIKGVAEEGYPCRADIFELTYEPVEEETL